eukprot:6179546-Pleurochrysis_carterae.AAC.2
MLRVCVCRALYPYSITTISYVALTTVSQWLMCLVASWACGAHGMRLAGSEISKYRMLSAYMDIQ